MTATDLFQKSLPALKLLDQVRQALRVRHYSLRTEQAYTHWVKRYVLFHGKRHQSGTPSGAPAATTPAADYGSPASERRSNGGLQPLRYLAGEALCRFRIGRASCMIS